MTIDNLLTWMRGNFTFIIVGFLVINLYQKKYGDEGLTKRMATLLFSFLLLAFYGFIVAMKKFGLPISFLWVFIASAFLVVLLNRKSFLPFKIKCTICGKANNWESLLFLDSNEHKNCTKKEESQEAQE